MYFRTGKWKKNSVGINKSHTIRLTINPNEILAENFETTLFFFALLYE